MISLPHENIFREVAEILVKKRSAVAFTGAGVSAESGVPTFRGPGGLWSMFRPEDVATPEAFQRDPVLVWKWYRWRIERILETRPNPGHVALAEMERLGLLNCVITQNVDELHRAAGSRCVIELHGSIRRMRCVSCGHVERIDDISRLETIPPKCPVCGSIMRPDVVWFGEQLPDEAWRRALLETYRAEVMLVIGTSGAVYPAAYLPQLAKSLGKIVVEINPEETELSEIADIIIRERSGEALPRILIEAKTLLEKYK